MDSLGHELLAQRLAQIPAVLAAMLRDAGAALFHLGLSQAGHPKHPLYIGYAVQPQPWEIDHVGH